jgi:hypothetical protein
MFAALFAALLLGSVASASASAEACTKKAGSKNFALCVEGQRYEAQAKITSTLASPTAIFEMKEWKEGSSPPMALVCTTLKSSPTLGGATAKFSFGHTEEENCALQNSKKCTSYSETPMLETVGEFGANAEQIHVKQVTGERDLMQFFLENAGKTSECPHNFLGTKFFTGQYECKLKEAEIESIQHELNCESQGRETRISNETAASIRYSQTLKLGGLLLNKKFSIYER